MTRLKVLGGAGAVVLATAAAALPAADAHTARPNAIAHSTTVAKCTHAQLQQSHKTSGTFHDAALNVQYWGMGITFENTADSCLLTFPRRVEFTNRTGKSVTTAIIDPLPSFVIADSSDAAVGMEVSWRPPEHGVTRGCTAALRNVTSATLKFNGWKVVFRIKPAFAGVCRTDGASMSDVHLRRAERAR